MDTKSQHCKHPKKMKSSKDKHEVFVLPPDLLKKLGISIGNINRSQAIPDNANGLPSTEIITNEHIEHILASDSSQKLSETSILETASLMKKSVFLSPTFVPTIANANTGEIEISGKNLREDSITVTDFVEPQGSVFVAADSIEVTKLLQDSNDTQEGCFKADQDSITLDREQMFLPNINQENPCMSLDGNEIQEGDINMACDEHLKEFESNTDNSLDDNHPFKNNNNVQFILNSTASESSPAPKAYKINIISEETIPLSKLREIKKQHKQFSNKKNVTSLPVQTIIETKLSIENRNSGLQSIREPNSTVPLENTKLLHLDVVKSGENTNQSNLNSMNSNGHIDTIAVPCVVSLKAEEKRRDVNSSIIGNVNLLEDARNLKDISKNRTDIYLNENKINKASDCELNSKNKSSEDNISDIAATVNGFDRFKEVTSFDADKSVLIDPPVNCIKIHSLEDNNHKCNKDNADIDSPAQKATGSKDHSTIKEIIKEESYLKSNTKQNSHSKNTFNNDSRVKRLSDHNVSSKNVEDKILEHDKTKRKLSSSITDIEVDKVKEIAAYLRKFSELYTDKKKTKMAICNDINKKETINTNTNTIESKLCIQGVEKPGGNVVDRELAGECKVLKTYARRNPSKASKLSTHILHKSETCNTVDALDLDLDAAKISTSSEMQEFCLCYDFGRLGYYDCDNLYEHIHFWHHHAANCELDLIFAIYSDETIVNNNESGLEQEEKTEDKIEAYNVCWNIYQKTIDHDMVDTAVSKDSDNIKNREKSLKNNINDNISAAGSGHVDSGISTSQSKLTPTLASKSGSSKISNVLEKTSMEESDDEEKPDRCKQSSSNENKLSRKEVKLKSSKTNDKTASKRRLSGNTTPGLLTSIDESSFKKSIKCALCNNIFSREDWDLHAANEHNFITWRAGSSINLENPELVHNLKERLKTQGVLECSICNMQIKKFNRFIEHLKYCIRKKLSNPNKPDKPARKSRIAIDDDVTCGVCQKTMLSSNWLEHIGSVHDYLAWKEGQDALNLDNESEVWQHLQNIIRLNGGLICYKCGLKRSRVKLYLAHIKTCDGSRVCIDLNSPSIAKTVEEPAEPTSVKCGVCEQDVARSDWLEHISKEHNYLAWQEGETPLDLEEEEAVWNHLQQFIRENGGLTCHKCGLVRKRVKVYLTHIETCDGTNSQVDNSSNNISLNSTIRSTDLNTTAKSTTNTDEWFEVPILEERKIVKCGVCTEEVPILEWLQHIGKEHDYLAWQDGATPLDLENELAVKVHLLEVSKQCGGLACNKCEKRMKYPKTYQQHIKECTGHTTLNDSKFDDTTSSWFAILSNKKIKDEILTCGVCANKIESNKWISHIEANHQYLAWVDGQPPLNLEDAVMVQRHLNDVSKYVGGLMCMKCGVKRRYVKSYLVHVETCQGKVNSGELPFALMSKDIIECAVCFATMEPRDWRAHAMKEHYNIAWVVGDNPIEINNPYAVESYLKEYQSAHHKLVCKVCGISRVSYVGFYAHIIVCGKTEKETDVYKSLCEICNNKYLRIYKSQHMTMHREKEYALERKLLAAKEQALKKEEEQAVDVIQTGRRKAAEKAKNVIEKYKSNFHDGSYHCSKCGFNSEIEKELSDHVCVEVKWGDATDSDESVKLEMSSSDDSDESDIDSNVSDEEREAREQQACSKKKKHSDSSAARICRLPYQVDSVSTYMKRSTEEFIETYLTNEDLFPLWHSAKVEEVPENEMVDYMPPIEESCKVRFDEKQEWVTFNRLESRKVKDTIVMFAGASIECMSWVPAAVGSAAGDPHWLCVATHRGPDAPRLAWDTTPGGPGLIQIWDCGNLIAKTPKFVLGITHDFGTVWSIDWCPSGARDELDFVPGADNVHRLGLLAAACSNGSAYIFVVPYPTSLTEKEKPFYKLMPVVELRATSNENRKVYQATAIKWSVQKGHSHVVVGYADGTTAFYDLNGESPLLRTTENNRTIFYPYHDERVQNSCIEDVDLYPGGWAARGGGVSCAGGVGGAGAGALQSHVAAAQVLYPPHWPAALLAGDDCLVNQSINELEWWGGGRRLGGACGSAGCAWCGRVCCAAPPLLRLMRTHPCFPEVHKQVIGRIMMIPFGGKRKRQNDELAMIVEPITYSDTVKKYGIEFIQVTARDRTTQQKLSATPRDAYPERFPLSDVAAMQFCPTFKLHHKLAIAMHSGLIFIINV